MQEEIINVKLRIREPHSKEQGEMIKSQAKRLVVKAGRRFGKTVGAAIKDGCLFWGICTGCLGKGCELCKGTGKQKPQRVLYGAPTAEQVSAYWFELKNMFGDLIEKGVLKKDETEKYIEVPDTKQRIRAKTMWNADTARGDYADHVTLEEYQLWNEDAWDEVILPMLADKDGSAMFIFTPPSLKAEGISKARDPRHASKLFKKALQDKTGRWQTLHFTSYQNPLLSKVALKEISQDMSLDAYRREILAEDDEIESSWLVLSKFNESLCKIKRFPIPKTWDIITGHDFGTANPAALFVARVRLPIPEGCPPALRYGDYVVFKEYSPGAGYSSLQHVEQFKDFTRDYHIIQSLGGNLTTEEEIRGHYGVLGWTISPPLMGKVNAQIDRVINLMESNKIYIFEDLYGLLGQIANCMWEIDEDNRATNKIKDESKYHLIACLRYLCTYLPSDRPVWSKDREKIPVKVW